MYLIQLLQIAEILTFNGEATIQCKNLSESSREFNKLTNANKKSFANLQSSSIHMIGMLNSQIHS